MDSIRIFKSNPILITAILLLGGFFAVSSSVFAGDIQPTAQGVSLNKDNAIIILSTSTLKEMQNIRNLLEKQGVTIRVTFPAKVLLAKVSRNLVDTLKSISGIEMISYDQIDMAMYKSAEPALLDGVRLWNKMLEENAKTGEERLLSVFSAGKMDFKKSPPNEKVIINDIPKTKEAIDAKNKGYLEHWNLLQQQLQQEQIPSQAPCNDSGTLKTSWLLSWWIPDAEAVTSNTITATPCTNTTTTNMTTVNAGSAFGKAGGAGFYDTSLYMAGRVAVGVFFVGWAPGEMDAISTDTELALNKFVDAEPNAHIGFTYIKEVDGSGHPNPVPSDEWQYVNDLRNTHETHWAYMIVIHKGVGTDSAHLFGPRMDIYSDNMYGSGGAYDGFSVRHGTMHIFGAIDQYVTAGHGPTERAGYLNVVNANSEFNDGQGYFGGSGEGIGDIMIARDGLLTGRVDPIGIYSRGQIGWVDSDADGIIDPLDTIPSVEILSKTGSTAFTYAGTARDKPLKNEATGYGDVTLNTIATVEYRINKTGKQGAWLAATVTQNPAHSEQADFTFTTPSLSNGEYTVEIRAINSVGNSQNNYIQDKLVITTSAVSNVAPFAALVINNGHAVGSVGVDVIADAGGSSDLEDDFNQLQFSWNCADAWTAFSPSATTNCNYTSAGLKTIRLQVEDTGGSIGEVSKQVEISSANQKPQAAFSVAPSRQFGDTNPFHVAFDADRSFDPENSPLQARWDFEGDGVWDTAYATSNLSLTHPYALPERILSTMGTLGYAQDTAIVDHYAYVAATFQGLKIIDIADPVHPVARGNFLESNAWISSVVVSGNFAYLADNSHGLKIINVTDKDNPVLVKTVSTLSQGISNVSVVGNFAYIGEKDGIHFDIVDISDPAGASVISTMALPDTGIVKAISDIAVMGDYAYVATNGKLHIINISNPVLPSLEYSYANSAVGVTVSSDGNYIYLAKDLQGIVILEFIDKTNPPIFKGQCLLPNSGRASSVALSADEQLVYVGDLYQGFHAVSLADKTQPVVRKTYETTTYPLCGDGTGDCVRQVTLSNHYAYVASSGAGLKTVDVSDKSPSVLAPLSLRWQPRLQVKDAAGVESDVVTREIQTVTYNHAPSLELTDLTMSSQRVCSLLGGRPGTATKKVVVAESGGFKYAYVADDSFKIYDVTDPGSSNVVKGSLVLTNPKAVTVSGNFAYVADDSAGLKIINIQNKSNPTLVKAVTLGDGNAVDVAIPGDGYAYVVTDGGSLKIVQNITSINASVVSTVPNIPQANGVKVKGNYVFVAARLFGFKIINATNKSSPSIIASVPLTNAYDVAIFGNYAYVANFETGLSVIDISNPASPVIQGTCDTPHQAIGVDISGPYAYVADTNSGIQIIDITNPLSPQLTGSFSTTDIAYSVFASGSNLYVAEGASGFQILKTDLGFKVAANGSDSDSSSSWDGILEYRWDIDNDGIWDMPFSADAQVNVAPAVAGLHLDVVSELRDRFGATIKRALPADVTAPTAPGKPFVPALQANNSFDIQWASSSDAESGVHYYELQRSDNGAGFQTIAYTSNTSFRQYGLSAAKYYIYRVRAFDNAGNVSAFSEVSYDIANNVSLATMALQTVEEGVALTLTPAVTTPTGGNLNFSVANLPRGASFNSATHTFIWTPDFTQGNNGQPALDHYDYTVTMIADGGAAHDTRPLHITVTNKNRPPILNSIADQTVYAGDLINLMVEVSDSDVDLDGDLLTASINSAPQGATVTVSGTENHTRIVTFNWLTKSANPDQRGDQVITINVNDSHGGMDSKQFTAHILNNAPVISTPSAATASVDENVLLPIKVKANDRDGDPLTYRALNMPVGATFLPYPLIGTLQFYAFSWTPDYTQAGSYPVTFRVTDSRGLATDKVVTITVNNVDRPPVLNPIDNKSINATFRLDFQLSATDPDVGDALMYSSSNLPAGATLSSAGAFSWAPTSAQRGSYQINFKVADHDGQFDSKSTTITVLNNPPLIAPLNNQTVYVNNTLTFPVTSTDFDTTDTITLSMKYLGAGTFPTKTGAGYVYSNFTWKPTATGTYYFTFNANDDHGGGATKTITVYVISGGGTCFLKGTPILMADGKTKSIERLKIGDKVMAYDEIARAFKEGTVQQTFKHKADEYLIINNNLKVTPNHPIYSDGKWVEAGNLKMGDNLLDINGKPVVISSIKKVSRVAKVYNLEVDVYHTYVAGGVVVHNKNVAN